LGTEPVPASALTLHRTGGGVDKIAIEEYKSDGKFFPVKALSNFRVNIVRLYKRKAQIIILESRNNLEKQWSFAKSLRKSKSVVEYLGRYTHKIAISNHRIQSVNDQNVTFGYKDYRVNKRKV
jgi:hypothetical protein